MLSMGTPTSSIHKLVTVVADLLARRAATLDTDAQNAETGHVLVDGQGVFILVLLLVDRSWGSGGSGDAWACILQLARVRNLGLIVGLQCRDWVSARVDSDKTYAAPPSPLAWCGA